MNTNFRILRQIREIKWPRNCQILKNAKFFRRENKREYSRIHGKKIKTQFPVPTVLPFNSTIHGPLYSRISSKTING